MQVWKLAMIGAVLVAGISANSAYTAGNTLNGDNVAGYGTSAVTGAIAQGIEHTLSADGTTINATTMTFTTDLNSGYQVRAGFGTAALQSCTLTLNTAPTLDTATCTYSPTFSTSTAGDFHVSVS